MLFRSIDAVWSFEHTGKDEVESFIYPDGCIDIIFQQKEGRIQPILCGVMNRTAKLKHQSDEKYYGVRIKPGYASAFFDLPIENTLNKTFALNKYFLNQTELLDFLSGDKPNLHIFEQVLHENLLRKVNLEKLKQINKHIDVMRDVEHGSIATLASTCQLSRRHFSRFFKSIYGLSPRDFTNIKRLNNFRVLSKEQQQMPLIDLALELGFTDQAHMNHCIKRTSGFTPKELLSQTYNT